MDGEQNMNTKKILAIMMCMLVTALIPAAAGMTEKTEPQNSQVGVTTITGIITMPRTGDGGATLSFRCILVHYFTAGVGHTASGNLFMLQKLTFPNHFTGYVRNHFIAGRFPGYLHA